MQRRFENKTMVITGGTTGIGEATAILFKEDGGHFDNRQLGGLVVYAKKI